MRVVAAELGSAALAAKRLRSADVRNRLHACLSERSAGMSKKLTFALAPFAGALTPKTHGNDRTQFAGIGFCAGARVRVRGLRVSRSVRDFARKDPCYCRLHSRSGDPRCTGHRQVETRVANDQH